MLDNSKGMSGDDTATMTMTVFMTPTTHALVRLLTVVRGRGAHVLNLRWEAATADNVGVATILIGTSQVRHPYLQTVIERIIDVRQVVVH
jgi:acetolactate synthase regulatory subunit